METLLRDVALGLRGLRRAPGFTAVAVLTLAVGVGATSSVFSVMNGTMLNALPWRDADSIVSMRIKKRGENTDARGATEGQYRDFRAQAKSFEDVVAYTFGQAYLTDRDDPVMTFVPRVSVNALEVIGVEPLLGRVFGEADGREGAEPVVMIGERLWRQRYAADPALVGNTIELNGEPVTVVGITSMSGWYPSPDADVLRPLHLGQDEAASRTDDRFGFTARLKPGVSVARAQAEMDVIMDRLAEQYPKTDAGLRAELIPTRDLVLDDNGRRAVMLLMGSVGFVLLIICANLANLLLARGATRHKEMATRAAMGATRGRLVRQLLAECAAIALLALPLGLLITRWLLDWFLSMVPPQVTWIDQFFRFDMRVVVFAMALSGVTVLVFGLSPALKASKLDLSSSLKEGGARGGTDAGSQRTRSVLVVTQIALALALLYSASLFLTSLANARSLDLGFDLDGAMSTTLLLPDTRYGDAESRRAFYARLIDGLEGLPGGARAGFTSSAPLGWNGPRRDFQIEGKRVALDEEPPRAHWSGISPDYFETLGLRLLRGRAFARSDREGSLPVVVINQAVVDEHFPGTDPIGKRIELTELAGMFVGGGSREIVGVVSNVTTFGGPRGRQELPRIYEPVLQQPVERVDIVVRSGGDPLAPADLVRQRVKALDERLSLAQTATMRKRAQDAMWSRVFFIRLVAALGVLALVLASMGIYGVVSYSTERRTREFGIRAALGAEPGQIASLVLRKTLLLGLTGIVTGTLLALLLSGVIQRVVYYADARDPRVIAGVCAVLLLVTLLASLVPVLRAVRAHPMQALRVE